MKNFRIIILLKTNTHGSNDRHSTLQADAPRKPHRRRSIRNIRMRKIITKLKKRKNMKTKIILWISVLLLLIGGVGCEKEQSYSPPADPAQAVLGKWELINSGGIPITPFGYKEFLSSGIVREYDYKKEQYTSMQCEYSILNDTVLLICNYRHKYLFFRDKMQLYPLDILTLHDPTEIYQRKK